MGWPPIFKTVVERHLPKKGLRVSNSALRATVTTRSWHSENSIGRMPSGNLVRALLGLGEFGPTDIHRLLASIDVDDFVTVRTSTFNTNQ